MPNLRGANPVGRDDRGLPYAARSISSGKSNRRQRARGDGVGRPYGVRRAADVDQARPLQLEAILDAGCRTSGRATANVGAPPGLLQSGSYRSR